MIKKYLLSVFTVLIAIVLCACQSTSQTHEKKAKEETHNKEENIYAKSVVLVKMIGLNIRVM